nr:MAG TPA: hypothetical protein [Caudoviricetes sp.]
MFPLIYCVTDSWSIASYEAHALAFVLTNVCK